MDTRLPRRIQIPLDEKMARALFDLAVREKRTTTDQTAILVRDRLIELGYLDGAPTPVPSPARVRAGEGR